MEAFSNQIGEVLKDVQTSVKKGKAKKAPKKGNKSPKNQKTNTVVPSVTPVKNESRRR